jgi:hypothetical protein
LVHLDLTYPNSEKLTQLPDLRAPPEPDHDDFTVQRDFDFGA